MNTTTKMYNAVHAAQAANCAGDWYREYLNWKLSRMYASLPGTVTNPVELSDELNLRAIMAYDRYLNGGPKLDAQVVETFIHPNHG